MLDEKVEQQLIVGDVFFYYRSPTLTVTMLQFPTTSALSLIPAFPDTLPTQPFTTPSAIPIIPRATAPHGKWNGKAAMEAMTTLLVKLCYFPWTLWSVDCFFVFFKSVQHLNDLHYIGRITEGVHVKYSEGKLLHVSFVAGKDKTTWKHNPSEWSRSQFWPVDSVLLSWEISSFAIKLHAPCHSVLLGGGAASGQSQRAMPHAGSHCNRLLIYWLKPALCRWMPLECDKCFNNPGT